MQTEFTCGIYTAEKYGDEWGVHTNGSAIAIIHETGESIRFLFTNLYISQETMSELFVLMNNIKIQYKQLNNG